jgi:phosphoribosyl 1,2-cyclic phosphodiesterase
VRVAVEITVLGSGSGGNCYYLEAGDTRLLVDAGFSGRQIRTRLESIGKTPETLTGILLTHEHSDHTKGLKMIAAKLGIPIYCNRLTLEAVETQFDVKFDAHVFQTGAAFDLGSVTVESFSVPHDAYDPVGFVVHTGEGAVGFLTDLGHATRLVIDRVKNVRALVLETNYDMKLLQEDTKRPWSIKQRILSRHGHLSNDAAAGTLEDLLSDQLRFLYLAHLSRDCNSPELAEQVISARLRELGAQHVGVMPTEQDQVSPTQALKAGASQ